MNSKLAIVASGGGMTCSYSVGSLLGLIDKFNITTPSLAIGASGGAGTLAYYVSGQFDSIKNIWSNLLSTKRFLNPLRFWKVIDIDYLIDDVFKRQDPLIVEQVLNSSTEFLIPSTNIKTGQVRYFSNKTTIDLFQILKATKAMPIVYGKAISIDKEKYCDTYLSSNVNLNIEKALSLGANKVLVLDNCSSDPVIENGLNLWIKTRSGYFKENYFKELKRIKEISFGNNVLYLRPEKKLKASTLDNKGSVLKETIDMGYNDTLSNKALELFLS